MYGFLPPQKYKLIHSDQRTFAGKKLYRIQACESFADVKKNDLGGYIEGLHNLSQEGSCWVYPGAIVSGNSSVRDHAVVYAVNGESHVVDSTLGEWSRVEDSNIFNSTLKGQASTLEANLRFCHCSGTANLRKGLFFRENKDRGVHSKNKEQA